MSEPIKFAAINFDHFHMGDLLRMAHEHPDVEIVGICDGQPARMTNAQRLFGIPDNRVHDNPDNLFQSTDVDLAVLCPAASKHGDWVERIAPFGCDLLVEKPFAGSLAYIQISSIVFKYEEY